MIASGQRNNTNAFHQRKDCEKQDHLESSLSLLDILWRFNFISNVYRACMLLWKRFTIFPRNLSCQRSYFRWKLVGLFFLRFPGWKWKICRDQNRLTFSSRDYATHTCASILTRAPTWACSQAKKSSKMHPRYLKCQFQSRVKSKELKSPIAIQQFKLNKLFHNKFVVLLFLAGRVSEYC